MVSRSTQGTSSPWSGQDFASEADPIMHVPFRCQSSHAIMTSWVSLFSSRPLSPLQIKTQAQAEQKHPPGTCTWTRAGINKEKSFPCQYKAWEGGHPGMFWFPRSQPTLPPLCSLCSSQRWPTLLSDCQHRGSHDAGACKITVLLLGGSRDGVWFSTEKIQSGGRRGGDKMTPRSHIVMVIYFV